jgi:hypothetical protein
VQRRATSSAWLLDPQVGQRDWSRRAGSATVFAEGSAIETSTEPSQLGRAGTQGVRCPILGTPFGPLVEALPAERRAALDAELERRIPAR